MNDSGIGTDSRTQEHSRRRVKLKRPPEKLYHKISEVADMLEVKTYVLRFWEKEFNMLKPRKNKAGNRIYQQKDIDLLFRIRDLLYKEGFTIGGARQRLRAERKQASSESDEGAESSPAGQVSVTEIRRELKELRREVEELITLFA